MLDPAAAFFRAFAPGAINEDAPHRLGGRSEKMRPVDQPRFAITAHKLQPRIVNQRGRLESLAGRFSRKLLLGHSMKLGIDNLKQLLLSVRLTVFSRFEKSR